ncbi:MAG: hypothetical protein V3V61_04915 [Gammaproteobacteria bacterium]
MNEAKNPAKKIIRSCQELPDWFDLEKYEAARQMSIETWKNNLFIRAISHPLHLEISDECYANIFKLRLSALKEDPLAYPIKAFSPGSDEKSQYFRPPMGGNKSNQYSASLYSTA